MELWGLKKSSYFAFLYFENFIQQIIYLLYNKIVEIFISK